MQKDPSEIEVPSFHRDLYQLAANEPEGQRLLTGDSSQNRRRYAIISASGGYDRDSGSIEGWITYGLWERKIKFRSTQFTTRQLSFRGAGGFLNEALPLEQLVGKTGTFSMSGNREVSMLWLWLGNELVCVPLILVGQGGAGHLGRGEVQFVAVG